MTDARPLPHRFAAVAVVVAMALLAGCGSSSSKSASSSGPSSDPNVIALCGALRTISSGNPNSDELQRALETITAKTPAELKDDLPVFVANTRAVAAAFSDAGALSSSVDVNAVLATLTPEQQAFAQELVQAQQTGNLPDDSTGRVFRYFNDRCATSSSSFSTVGSAVN